jgi:hypothetical protein
LTSEKQLSSNTLRYLTGALIGDERESFETRLLLDHDFSDAVAVCEQELIDSYALGQMDPAEARSFQSWIDAVPARAERVRMARALLQKSPQTMGGRRQLVAVILAAAACVLIAIGITLHSANKSESKSLASQAKPPSAEKSLASAVSSPEAVTPPLDGSEKAVVILLVAERLRGEEPITQFRVRPGASIELQVLLTGKAPDTPYKLQIVSSDPKPRILVERKGLKVHEKEGHRYIEVTLPAGSLPAKTYDVFVSERDNRLFSRFAIR